MEETDVNERLWAIANRFSVPRPTGLLGLGASPFDVSRPNLHDSKADFLEEMSAVSTALENARPLLELLYKGVTSAGGPEQGVVTQALKYIDATVRSKHRSDRLDSVFDLTRSNAAKIGFSITLMYMLFDFVEALKSRKQELESQAAIFWSGAGRAPNHYARTIALRFAKLVARSTGKKPTFGTARDGGHPSTDFGRALEEIFGVLKVKADVRNAARWAVGELVDGDLQPLPGTRPPGLLFGDTRGLTWPKPGDPLFDAMLGKGP